MSRIVSSVRRTVLPKRQPKKAAHSCKLLTVSLLTKLSSVCPLQLVSPAWKKNLMVGGRVNIWSAKSINGRPRSSWPTRSKPMTKSGNFVCKGEILGGRGIRLGIILNESTHMKSPAHVQVVQEVGVIGNPQRSIDHFRAHEP